MKRTGLFFALIIVIGGLVGCRIASRENTGEQSAFKQDFSLGAMVARHPELLLEGSLAASGVEAGPRAPFTQSQEYMVIQVEPANLMPLLTALQSDLEETLSTSGSTVLGYSGEMQPDPIAYLSYQYSEGPFYGTVNLWGLRGQGNTLTLISEITESKGSQK